MTLVAAHPLETSSRASVMLVALCSLFLHAIVLMGIPVVMALLKPASRHYSSPQAFQVVTLPQAASAPARAKAAAKPKPTQEAVPSARPTSRTPEKVQAQEEEEVDELAQLLSDLPAPTSIAAVGTGFTFPLYLQIVQQKIERQWSPPMKKEGVQVVVTFVIAADGSINEPSIVESCGIETLDNLALRAVKLAAPFGRLPPGYSGNQLTVNCTLKPVAR